MQRFVFRQSTVLLGLCSLLAGFLISPPISAQVLQEDQLLQPSDPALRIGRKVALDGDRIAIAGSLSTGGLYDGVHVFEKDHGGVGQWGEVTRLLPSDFDATAQFGGSLALDGDTIVVGAYNDDDLGNDAGAVYVFERDSNGTWSQNQQLYASNAMAGERLGDVVAVDGDVLAASTIQGDSVHIYERDGSGLFIEVQDFALTSPEDLDLEGDTLVVAPFNYNAPNVKVYRRGAGGIWTLSQTLTGTARSRFGAAVNLSGDLLAVGAYNESTRGSGAAFVYERNAAGLFELIHSVYGGDFGMNNHERFGIDVSLHGDTFAVAASNEKLLDKRGTTRVFRRDYGGVDSWGLSGILTASDVGQIGGPIDLQAGRLIAGSGVGYLFELGTSDLELSAGVPRCAAESELPLNISATGSQEVDLLSYSVDFGNRQTICIGCGFDPSITAPVQLSDCGLQRIDVEAVDAGGTRVGAGGTVRLDGQAPELSFCADQTVVAPAGTASVRVSPPRATDNCDNYVRVFCDHPDYYFSVGTTTTVQCTVSDSCENVTDCSYDVTVIQESDPEPPPTGCESWTFFDEPGMALPPAPWRWSNLGDSASIRPEVNEDGLIIRGYGSSMYHGDDNGMFVFQDVVESDFRIETELPEAHDFNGADYLKGGLMVRYGLDARAARAMVMLVPSHPNGYSLQFDARPAQGATARELGSTIPAHGIDRLAIEKVGSTFTVYFSRDDGATWIRPAGGLGGSVELTGNSEVLQVGMAISAGTQTHDGGFAFHDFDLCYLPQEPTEPPPVAGCLDDDYGDNSLDSTWQLLAMGDADQVGVQETGGQLELSGDGSTLFSSDTDHGAFYYRPVDGNFRIEVDVDASGMNSGGPYRKQGLMAKTSLDDSAVRAIAQLAPYWNDADEAQLQFRYRGSFGGAGNQTWASNRSQAPRQARLAIERTGNTLRTEYSFDGGSSWIQPTGGVGGAVTLNLPQTLYVGLNTVSYDTGTAVTGVFDDLSLCALPSISGRLWWDIDADGVQDDDELPITGAEVDLRNPAFIRIATLLTDADGSYAFPDLAPGSYFISTDSFIGDTVQGPPESTYDPDGPATLDHAAVDVGAGEQVVGFDFGYRADINPLTVCEDDDFDDGSLDDDWHAVTLGDADDFAVTESGGGLSLSGDGSSLYAATQDHGVFLFREVQGDFRVEVDVDTAGMTGSGAYQKAGLMIRTGLSSSDIRLIAQSIPYWNNGTTSSDSVFQTRYRASEGGAGDGAWGSNFFSAPRQLRMAIERVGNVASVSYSEDAGATWKTPAGGAGGTISLNLPDQLLVGLNVVSYDADPSTAQFDNFTVCPLP